MRICDRRSDWRRVVAIEVSVRFRLAVETRCIMVRLLLDSIE